MSNAKKIPKKLAKEILKTTKVLNVPVQLPEGYKCACGGEDIVYVNGPVPYMIADEIYMGDLAKYDEVDKSTLEESEDTFAGLCSCQETHMYNIKFTKLAVQIEVINDVSFKSRGALRKLPNG